MKAFNLFGQNSGETLCHVIFTKKDENEDGKSILIKSLEDYKIIKLEDEDDFDEDDFVKWFNENHTNQIECLDIKNVCLETY